MLPDVEGDDHNSYSPSVRLLEIERHGANGCGFHLTRGKWDPYPWVVDVDDGSPAETAGVHPGDCLLEVNGEDIVGLRITEVAELVKARSNQVSLLLWNAGIDPQCTPEALCCGPMPKNLKRLSMCMTSILTFLECPVCLDTILPPTHQCDNGHLICVRCRAKSERCPVCRQRLARGRSLLADQVYNAFTDAFDLHSEPEETRIAKMQQIFKHRNKNKIPEIKITQSHTNKFLAKIIGKSSSVDNLSGRNLTTRSNHLIQDDFNMKIKSLSTNEIFSTISPIVSRQGSMSRISAPRLADIKYLSRNRPASYHGSLEHLTRKTNDDLKHNSAPNQLQQEDGILYYCPHTADCYSLIQTTHIWEHFKTHDGPLVQYFRPKFRLNFSSLTLKEDFLYIINIKEGTFFTRISPYIESEKMTYPDTLLWTWCLGSKNASSKYQMHVNIFTADAENKTLLSVQSELYPLSSISFQEIKESRKGIYLGAQTLESFLSSKSDIVLEIEIATSVIAN